MRERREKREERRERVRERERGKKKKKKKKKGRLQINPSTIQPVQNQYSTYTSLYKLQTDGSGAGFRNSPVMEGFLSECSNTALFRK